MLSNGSWKHLEIGGLLIGLEGLTIIGHFLWNSSNVSILYGALGVCSHLFGP